MFQLATCCLGETRASVTNYWSFLIKMNDECLRTPLKAPLEPLIASSVWGIISQECKPVPVAC